MIGASLSSAREPSTVTAHEFPCCGLDTMASPFRQISFAYDFRSQGDAVPLLRSGPKGAGRVPSSAIQAEFPLLRTAGRTRYKCKRAEPRSVWHVAERVGFELEAFRRRQSAAADESLPPKS